MGKRQKNKTKGGGGGSQHQQAAATNKSQENAPTAHQELSKSAKKEISELITHLLDVCAKTPETGPKECEDYPEIHAITEKIRKIQTVLSLPEKKRSETFPKFLSWLKEYGVDTSHVEIVEFPEVGFGLQTVKDIQESEKILDIPRKLMLTVESAKESNLGVLITEDKILQVMPNVTLALHLLNEKLNPQSFWKPYIDSLPSSYDTPLYWKPDEIQLLKGSPVQGDSFNQYRNIARQYAYFHRLLQKNHAVDYSALKNGFTFDSYRWAVSTIMTRQNQIPGRNGSRATLGLIPFWDMCNHTGGIYTSDYNKETDSCECYAIQAYTPGDQIEIFYGPRSNGEFLVNSGFVYPENEHDRLCMKLGISKGDSLFALKSELLGKINLAPSRSFYLHRGKFPVDGDLLGFLRVFCMDEGTLKEQYCGDSAPGPEELEALKDEDALVSKENEEKVWGYLQTRATILLKGYTPIEDDQAVVERKDSSYIARMAANLRICERHILENAIQYSTNKRDKFL